MQKPIEKQSKCSNLEKLKSAKLIEILHSKTFADLFFESLRLTRYSKKGLFFQYHYFSLDGPNKTSKILN